MNELTDQMAACIFRYMVEKWQAACVLEQVRIELFEVIRSDPLYDALFLYFGINTDDEDERQAFWDRMTDAEITASAIPDEKLSPEQVQAHVDLVFSSLKVGTKRAVAMH